VHQDDDFLEYRHASPALSWPAKPPASVRPQGLTEAARRADYAKALARAAFGRFFWGDQLGRRMAEEMNRSQRLKKEQSAKHAGKRR
jgi:hypothetical protein